MLKLTYSLKRDEYQTVTVLGDPMGIRDLYWQLTSNYSANDGTGIGRVYVSTLGGEDVTQNIMASPYSNYTRLNNLD